MQRVKCCICDRSTNKEQRILVSYPPGIRTVERFVKHVLKDYCGVSKVSQFSISLDGFQIRESDDISILRPNDIISISYSKSSEKKEKHKKKCSEEEKSLSEPLVIDHSADPPKDGFIVPTNKIIRFTEEEENNSADAITMKVEPEPSYYGQNTNTPTINARPKKKSTRRGKRAGRKQQSNVSFMDFISNDPPSVLAPSCNTSYIESTRDAIPSIPAIPKNDQDDSIVTPRIEKNASNQKEENVANNKAVETTKYVPCIQDVIRYQRLYMDYSTYSPSVKEVEGRITNISGDTVYIYLFEEDEMDQQTKESLSNAVVISGPSLNSYVFYKHLITCFE